MVKAQMNNKTLIIDFKNRLLYEEVIHFNGINIKKDAREVNVYSM